MASGLLLLAALCACDGGGAQPEPLDPTIREELTHLLEHLELEGTVSTREDPAADMWVVAHRDGWQMALSARAVAALPAGIVERFRLGTTPVVLSADDFARFVAETHDLAHAAEADRHRALILAGSGNEPGYVPLEDPQLTHLRQHAPEGIRARMFGAGEDAVFQVLNEGAQVRVLLASDLRDLPAADQLDEMVARATAAAWNLGDAAPGPITGGWLSYAIGGARPGTVTSLGDRMAVEGYGDDVWYGYDQFHFVARPLAGDFSVEVLLESVEAVHEYTKAGLMVRATLAPDSAAWFLSVFPSGQTEWAMRPQKGAMMDGIEGPMAKFPVRLRLARGGPELSAEVNGTVVGSASWPAESPRLEVGLGVVSQYADRPASAAFAALQWTGQPANGRRELVLGQRAWRLLLGELHRGWHE